ncbi:hypothetical protein ACFVYA_12815 [Amycolatopsis sp. NPDC058278]|uniref:hypothetical protein n=1 Tax=Amycolatopsis sp. NPDC058278 TaxID=3346417 RepID=UPI0036DB5F56
MNDQPREEKAPERAEQPTVEHPAEADQPTAASTTPTETSGGPATPASEPAVPAAPTADTAVGPAAAGPSAPGQAAGAAPADQPADPTAVHGRQPPPQPGPGQPYGPWGPPPAAPRQPGGFRRFVGHRATQLVGVGVLGMLLGATIVGGIAAASHHGPRDGRPGIHRQYDGPNQGFNGHGPGFGGRGNNNGNPGNPGNSGSGDGI